MEDTFPTPYFYPLHNPGKFRGLRTIDPWPQPGGESWEAFIAPGQQGGLGYAGGDALRHPTFQWVWG